MFHFLTRSRQGSELPKLPESDKNELRLFFIVAYWFSKNVSIQPRISKHNEIICWNRNKNRSLMPYSIIASCSHFSQIFIPSYGHDYSSNVGHLKRMVELTVRGHLFFVAPALHSTICENNECCEKKTKTFWSKKTQVVGTSSSKNYKVCTHTSIVLTARHISSCWK